MPSVMTSSEDSDQERLLITTNQIENRFNALITELQALYNEVTFGLFTSSPDNVITYINPQALTWLEFTEEDLIGNLVTDYLSPASVAPYLRYQARTSHGRVYDDLEIELHTKSGRTLNCLLYSTAMLNADGSVLSIRSVLFDVTAQRLAEKNLRITALAFDESKSGKVVTDLHAKILHTNDAFSVISGYSKDEVIGLDLNFNKAANTIESVYLSMWDDIQKFDHWEGEVWKSNKSGELYLEQLSVSAVKDEHQQVIHYLASMTDITNNQIAFEKIKHLAFYDELTGLPNRVLMVDRLNQTLANSARETNFKALVFIDLDDFKLVNDSLGHDVGDALLYQVAQRLRAAIREGDTVARQGGDEFILIMQGFVADALEAAKQVEQLCKAILLALSAPYVLLNKPYYISASAGVVLFKNNKKSPKELMKRADIAMYQAKKRGRNQVCFFDPAMQQAIDLRASMERALHDALMNNQFKLYYQIQVDQDEKPIGAEALIRWQHPTRGVLNPVAFIPYAEESTLIVSIGLWVLDTACKQLSEWLKNPLTKHLVCAVNVSAKQFGHTDFYSQVKSAIDRYQIPPNQLKLELTESVLLEDAGSAIPTITALASLGLKISLDDFGTGYSSLQYLRLLPISEIKIDQAFVRDMATDAKCGSIVKTIIVMSDGLGFKVIAEGVETAEQKSLLMENGCFRFQGYLFGKPKPIDVFEQHYFQSTSS